jgi:hypothetical protein
VRRITFATVAVLGLTVVAFVSVASSKSSNPVQLAAAGWSCPVVFGAVHCLPPGTGVKSPASPSLTALVFGGTNPNDADAPFLGTEHLLHADVFEKGGRPPCRQDPPTYEYKDLRTTIELPIPYYACHHYDSSF